MKLYTSCQRKGKQVKKEKIYCDQAGLSSFVNGERLRASFE
jgi:hypothetical protein